MGTQKRLITYEKDGNSLEGQRSALLSAYPTALFYQEAYIGMTTDRPELSKILAKIKKGQYAGSDKTYDDTIARSHIPRGSIMGGNEKSKRKEATKER